VNVLFVVVTNLPIRVPSRTAVTELSAIFAARIINFRRRNGERWPPSYTSVLDHYYTAVNYDATWTIPSTNNSPLNNA